jgi:hypothetical protein
MPRNYERLNGKIEQEERINRVHKNDLQSLDQHLNQYKTNLIHALNNDPNKYASLDMCQKETIKSLLGMFNKKGGI